MLERWIQYQQDKGNGKAVQQGLRLRQEFGDTPEVGENQINPDNIITAISSYFQISSEELKGRSRRAHINEARKIGYLLILELTPLSMVGVGLYFGRDHSTISKLVAGTIRALSQNEQLQTAVFNIRASLDGKGL